MVHRKTLIDLSDGRTASMAYLKGVIRDARVTTLQRIEGLSVAELDWQYAPGWNTIGALLSHIIGVQNFFRIHFIEQRELTEAENAKWLAGLDLGPHVPSLICGKNIETYQAELAESLDLILAALDTLDQEQFTRRREGYDPETGHNLAWTMYHMAEDEIHHRGQISILRKLYQVHLKSKQ